MNLGKRLKKAREARGLNQQELADRVNERYPAERPAANQAAISALETRDSLTTELLFDFADVLRVNPRWLLTGQPETDTGLESDQGWAPKTDLSPDERTLLKLYGDLPKDARPSVHEVIAITLRLAERAGVSQTRTRQRR